MSLVNLSHVCSHLQNASLARLGLTSIPYTRLHLSLSLLLHKQGFLSQVKLAGASPPASCFPPGERDNHRISAHPHADRGRFTPEAALQEIVRQGTKGSAEALRLRGFKEEAIEFALREREKTKAQLKREGWHEVAARFFVLHGGKSADDMRRDGMDEEVIAIVQKHSRDWEEVMSSWYSDAVQDPFYHAQGFNEEDRPEHESLEQFEKRRSIAYGRYRRDMVYKLVLEGDFLDAETLRYFAGPENRYLTSRDLTREGISISAMGLEVENQPFSAPAPPAFSDPWQLEEEGVVTQANRASRRLWLGLKYWDGMPVLRKARMLSKPSKRIRLEYEDLGRLIRGRSAGEVKPLTQVGEIMAVQTKDGVMEVRECVERKMGGMMLCRVF